MRLKNLDRVIQLSDWRDKYKKLLASASHEGNIEMCIYIYINHSANGLDFDKERVRELLSSEILRIEKELFDLGVVIHEGENQ